MRLNTTRKHLRHLRKPLLCLCFLFALSVGSAGACTMVYVGGDFTEDGSAYYGRSADWYWSYINNLAYVSPHGLHPAGETYIGCYDFPDTAPTKNSWKMSSISAHGSSG